MTRCSSLLCSTFISRHTFKMHTSLLWRFREEAHSSVSSGFASTMSLAPQPRGNFYLHHYHTPGPLMHCIVSSGLRKEKTPFLLSSQNQRKREQRENVKERLEKALASQKSLLFSVSLSSSLLHSTTFKGPKALTTSFLIYCKFFVPHKPSASSPQGLPVLAVGPWISIFTMLTITSLPFSTVECKPVA